VIVAFCQCPLAIYRERMSIVPLWRSTNPAEKQNCTFFLGLELLENNKYLASRNTIFNWILLVFVHAEEGTKARLEKTNLPQVLYCAVRMVEITYVSGSHVAISTANVLSPYSMYSTNDLVITQWRISTVSGTWRLIPYLGKASAIMYCRIRSSRECKMDEMTTAASSRR